MSDVASFPITKAQLTGNYCETLTYGMYLVTCCFCFKTLLFIDGPGGEERLRRPSEIRWFMVSVAVCLFLIGTYDDVIGLVHNIAAFVEYTGPGGAKQELTNVHDWINISRSVAQVCAATIGDLVLIYRCWIVYGRRYPVIIASVILYLGGIAAGLKLCVIEALTSNPAITLGSEVTKPWFSAFFAITAAQNVLTTSLLIWRIWRVEYQIDRMRNSRLNIVSAQSSQPRLRRVMRVIAESGAAYTTMVVMSFIATVSGSNALYPISDATLQATGITFNVIIIRSTPKREKEFTTFDTNTRAMAEQGHGPVQHLSTLHFTTSANTGTLGDMTNNIELSMTSVPGAEETAPHTKSVRISDLDPPKSI